MGTHLLTLSLSHILTAQLSFSLALQIARNLSLPQKSSLHMATLRPPGQLALLVGRHKRLQHKPEAPPWSLFPGVNRVHSIATSTLQHSLHVISLERGMRVRETAFTKALLWSKLWARCFTYIAYESMPTALVPSTHSCSPPEKQPKQTENLWTLIGK